MVKITHQKRYTKKQKPKVSKDDDFKLFGEQDMESFSGSRTELESAADHLFTSPPRQINKIESKLDHFQKSLENVTSVTSKEAEVD